MKDNKKSPEETASIFDAITKASVSGNPKPKQKKKKKKKNVKGQDRIL